jgi:hypothetical protein
MTFFVIVSNYTYGVKSIKMSVVGHMKQACLKPISLHLVPITSRAGCLKHPRKATKTLSEDIFEAETSRIQVRRVTA